MEENELKNWFDNLKNKIKNKTTIFLNISNNDVSESIFNDFKLKINGINKIHYSNGNMKTLSENTIILKSSINHINTNFSFIENKRFLSELFKNPIIIINDNISIREFINILINFQENETIEYFGEKIKYYVLEKKDFEMLIRIDKNELISLIEKEHKYLIEIFSDLPILNTENLNMQKEILDKHNVLSANFANYLYKFAYFDFAASSTKIGRNVRQIFGIKSKTINNIRIFDSMSLQAKPFKGYDLKTDKYLDIKKKIAQKLIRMKNIKKLDTFEIAKITELPIKEIKKLY
ncbi:hypothetical protein LXN10_01100 [Arcobacter sp. KX21116]|uniref:hypothetical protein n=1 Tax=Arcobacter iocasae TaxID=2906515 RepID=UPI0035D4CF02